MVSEFKFFQRNKFKDRCRLEIGSSFHYRGYYCTVSRMLPNHFEYIRQETQQDFRMSYEHYLTTPSAAGRQLNRS
jgi:hypothetical protein